MNNLIKIGGFDRFLLRSETQQTPAHTASLNLYRLPRGASRSYLHDLFVHLRRFPVTAAPFNYVLADGFRSRRYWRVVDDVDLEYHLRHSALPYPGGERELGTLVSRLHGHQLDFSRPLWEFHLIEGLENNRFATYLKMHHALADGVAVVNIITAAMAESADADPLPPPWALAPPVVAPSGPGTAASASGSSRPAQSGSLLKALGRTLRAQLGRRTAGFVAPYAAPKCVLNTNVTPARRYATQSYKLDRLKAVGNACGGTVNDVVLAICSTALRRYLQEMGELPDRSIIALVPVALQREMEETAGSVVAALTVSLATDIVNPQARLAAIIDSSALAKSTLCTLPRWKMEIYSGIVMLPFAMGRLARRGAPWGLLGNLGISNVPGPRKKLYFQGAEVESLYPCSVLMRGYPLNITARSYNDSINFGFLGCRDVFPHFQHLAVYAGEALAELERVYGIPRVDDPAVPTQRSA